ncbi:MAG: CDF family Co(II)/Ni(II) efflux transporter DmeF [Acidobacteria bacterium]|nr:CDF family Co(II)/Ni(II) efflux transporter DmeF [Acidobacteriota bacterium]
MALHGHGHEGNPLAERNTRWAVLLTAMMMVAEITCGWLFNSMALLADGWHMSSHTLALGLTAFAYAAARRLANHPRFPFGTWKIEILGSYTSALFLVGIAGLMLFQSIQRLIEPSPIHYNQAIGVAILGLLVNLACVFLLNVEHHHEHAEDHDHEHRAHAHDSGSESNHHHDLNLRAAYLHVLTDALTSILAIIALIGGKIWGANWLDPAMGIVGAFLVLIWAWGLLRDSGTILLDAEPAPALLQKVRQSVEEKVGPIEDLHIWRIAKNRYACILSITTPKPITAQEVKAHLQGFAELSHITVEINPVRESG